MYMQIAEFADCLDCEELYIAVLKVSDILVDMRFKSQ